MDDVIPVRPGEQIDSEALVVWLQLQPDLPSGTPVIHQFGGGKANLTYLLTFPGGEELVLRRPPLGPVAASAHDMSREYTVLANLWREFPRAPRALAYSPDDGVIGAPFFLMEKKDGVVVRRTVPPRFGGGNDPSANRSLSKVVVTTLADFHSVDANAAGLSDLGRPDGFLERQVKGWRARWDAAKDRDDPLAEELGNWLADNLPPSTEQTLLHNDWRLDNMAVAEDDPGQCVAVFDWDMATRGDPLADLGTLMGSWYDPGEAPEGLGMMPTTAPGWMPRSEALELYARTSGRDLASVGWYLVFGCWKLAIILQQIHIRWLRGQTTDQRFATLGEDARLLFQLASDRRI